MFNVSFVKSQFSMIQNPSFVRVESKFSWVKSSEITIFVGATHLKSQYLMVKSC